MPPLKDAMGTISNTVGANQPHLDQMASDLRGFLPGLGQKAFGANPALDATMQYATGAIGGKYLDQQNPYLQGMIDQTSDDVTDRVNALASKSGASLGTQHFGMLAKELANAQNSLRYGNYAQERQMQQGAAGLMPSLNASQYAGVMPYLAANQTAAGLPFAGISNLGLLGNIVGGFGTQTGTQKDGWLKMMLDAGAAAAGAAAAGGSDRRMKKDIVKLGELSDGLGIYEWTYKVGPGRYRGVMADEVEKLRPHALGKPLPNGYATVNYGALGSDFAALGLAKEAA